MVAGDSRKVWAVVLGAWLLAAAVIIAGQLLAPGPHALLADTDDAMRMVTATDLLDGQGWRDSAQYRDNAPYGTSMHWSRLIDVPLAGLIAIGRLFAFPDLAAIVWPLLLLLPLLTLSVLWARRVVGPDQTLAAVVLPLISLTLLAEFSPGRVDHHNVQILLLGSLALAVAESGRHRPAPVLAGILAAASLAIGMETLPFAILAIALYALLWATDPRSWHRPMRTFGGSLALATAGFLALAVPPSAYLAPVCDMLSPVYALATLLAAGVLLLASSLSRWLPNLSSRVVLLAILGAVATGVLVMVYPECARGPYAQVDPRMMALFSEIAEAQPLHAVLAGNPALAIAVLVPPLVALPVMVLRIKATHGDERLAWIVLLAFAAMALALTVVQFRSARLTATFAVPAGVWLIAQARRRYVADGRPLNAAGLVVAWLAFAGIAQFSLFGFLAGLAPATVQAAAPSLAIARTQCFAAGNFADLAALPPGIVLAPPELGPHILHYTGHSVVSAGFHRNVEGTLDSRAFFEAGEEKAHAIALRRGVTYVVGCPVVPLASRWSWLTPVHAQGGTLEILKISEGNTP